MESTNGSVTGAGLLREALDMLRVPSGQLLSTLSTAIGDLVPHDGLVLVAGDCVLMDPLLEHGIEGVRSAEVAPLAGKVEVGRPWFGSIELAGELRTVLSVAASPVESSGALLLIVTTHPEEPSPEVQEIVQLFVEFSILHLTDRIADSEPATADGRSATSVHDLTDAHAATLTSLLGILRSRRLDDAAAREAAIGVAVPALIETRHAAEEGAGDEDAGSAFESLAHRLRVLARYEDVDLDLVGVDDGRTPLDGPIARAARSVTRGAVLASIQQGGVTRIRVSWQLTGSRLEVTVRDDGPGAISPEALVVHRLRQRLAAVSGTVTVESVPTWGTTVSAVLPLAAAESAPPCARELLNPREREVLDHLVLGHRNRKIAEQLHISEHTVKFHVANILGKLQVGTRGEAAALARNRSAASRAG